jgi:hypothetical protein
MRALDDILVGFLIFFALDRLIRLFSNSIVEPWAMKRTGNKDRAENWKIFSEFLLLMGALGLVFRYQRQLRKVNTA